MRYIIITNTVFGYAHTSLLTPEQLVLAVMARGLLGIHIVPVSFN